MTDQEKTALGTHDNKCFVAATLSEINLEKATVTKNGKTSNVIRGTIVGKISDVNSITLRVYASELTNSGSPNKAYAHLEEIMTDWKSSIASAGENSALRFTCNADFSPTHYMGTNDYKMHEGVPQYRANFFTKAKENDEKFEPKAEIKCDFYVSSLRPEVGTDSQETGRWILDGWVCTYTGIEKATFIIPAEMANGVDNYIKPKQTLYVYANAVNSAITKTIVRKMAIGADHTETKTEYKNELILTGASDLSESDDPEERKRVFDETVMTNAINEYRQTIENLKNGGGQEKAGKAQEASTKPMW